MKVDFEDALRQLDRLEWGLRQGQAATQGSPIDNFVGHLVQHGFVKGASAISRDLLGSGHVGGRWARKEIGDAKKNAAKERAEVERATLLAALDGVDSVIDASAAQLSPKTVTRFRRESSKARTAARPDTVRRRSLALIGLIRVELRGAAQLPPPQESLFLLEQKFRRMIRERLSAKDAGWWRSSLPSDVRTRAEERAAGRTPLVDFLDFGDYLKIIIQKNNWNEHFRHVFPSRDWISFRLQELGSIRNDIAHSRHLSYDSAIKLRVLSKEIIDKIG